MLTALFFIYLILFTWIIVRTDFFLRSGLSKAQLAGLFIVKTAAGVFYGWFYLHYYHQGDSWFMYQTSLSTTRELMSDPSAYFRDFFFNPYENTVSGFFASRDSYWNNLKNNSFIALQSVFNCFSFGNYYINVLFYAFLTFWGVVAVFKVMQRHYYRINKHLLIFSCFLIPSFLFWTSGLHKDGIIFLALGTILYIIYFRVYRYRPFISYCLLMSCMVLLFAIRNHILFTLLPALFCWVVSRKWPHRQLYIFAGVYAAGTLLFFLSGSLSPGLDLPAIVAEKQAAFSKLQGGSSLSTPALQPGFAGFLKNLPKAIELSMFRPFLNDIRRPWIWPAFIEMVLIWLLVLLRLLNRKPLQKRTAFGIFLLVFSVTSLLVIGYTVNIIGAIVRYRAFLLPFIVTPLLAGINWKKRLPNKY